MSKLTHLEFTDTNNGETFVRRASLPMAIGRSPLDEGYDKGIVLNPLYENVSKLHGAIHSSESGAYYIDRSKNGSLVDGHRVHRASAPLSKAFILRIGPYIIRPIELVPLRILAVDADLIVTDDLDVLPGSAIAALSDSGHVSLVEVPPYHSKPDHTALLFRSEKDELECIKLSAAPIKLNRGSVAKTRFTVPIGSVIELDGHRIEIIQAGQKLRVCGNGKCQLLTNQPIDHECKWCGHNLAKYNITRRD